MNPVEIYRAKLQRQREVQIERERDRVNAHAEQKVRQAYLAAGGDDEHFDFEWPQMRRRLLADAAIKEVQK